MSQQLSPERAANVLDLAVLLVGLDGGTIVGVRTRSILLLLTLLAVVAVGGRIPGVLLLLLVAVLGGDALFIGRGVRVRAGGGRVGRARV